MERRTRTHRLSPDDIYVLRTKDPTVKFHDLDDINFSPSRAFNYLFLIPHYDEGPRLLSVEDDFPTSSTSSTPSTPYICKFTHASQSNVPQEIFAVGQYPKFLLDSSKFISVSVINDRNLKLDSYLRIGMVERQGDAQKHYTRCLLWIDKDGLTPKTGSPYFSISASGTDHKWTEGNSWAGWIWGTNRSKIHLRVDDCELYRICSDHGYKFRHNGQVFQKLRLISWPCVDDPHRLILSFENDPNTGPAFGLYPFSMNGLILSGFSSL